MPEYASWHPLHALVERRSQCTARHDNQAALGGEYWNHLLKYEALKVGTTHFLNILEDENHPQF
jgi:hypothetical protein